MMWFDGGGIRGKLESCMRNMVCLSGSFLFGWKRVGGGRLIFFCLVFFADFI